MKLLVLEGPDVTGKTTILNALSEKYKDNNRVGFLYFPSDKFWGKVASFAMSHMKSLFVCFPRLAAEIFLKDFVVAQKTFGDDSVVISSRWYYSTLAYESIYKKGYAQYRFIRHIFDRAKHLDLVEPVHVWYLTLPKTQHKAVMNNREEPSKHFFEKSFDIQEKVEKAYDIAFTTTNAHLSYINNSFELAEYVVESISRKIDSLL